MGTVIFSIAIFLIAVIIHLIACRFSPYKILKAKLFIMIALAGLLMLMGSGFLFHLPLIWTSTVIYILLIPVYLIFYVSTELTSPSKKILKIVESKGGATYVQIFEGLERENFITTRLEELVQSGCAQYSDGRYALTASGWGIARVLNVYQKLLGRDIGG